MDKQELDAKVKEVAKALLSYCSARTSNHFDAEDLAQEIILEIYKSSDRIRDVNAIYAFIWGVAGNVYKQWCRNRAKSKTCELTEGMPDEAEMQDEDHAALYLLRRELTLLSEKYRKAVVLYYIKNKSCSEISNTLSISESMVKYLLFKSRQILKEGMSMERNYGQQSYVPKELTLLFWGNGTNRYYHLCDSRISQNILFACYHDKLSAEQISLEIGVALPYMEDKLAELCEYELLKKDGNRYYTNMVIFTTDFAREVKTKTAVLQGRIADKLMEAAAKYEDARAIGFYGADMSNTSFSWQITCFILYQAVIEMLQSRVHISYPRDRFGTECFVWGAEKGEQSSWGASFGFGTFNAANNAGDYVQFMDFAINGEMVHHFFGQQSIVNVFLDIAKGHTEHFSENDRALAAEMIRKGYVISNHDHLFVNVPVLTVEQYEALKAIFAETSALIADEAEALMETVAKILKDHAPVHLKKLAKGMSYLRLFEDAISAPISILYDRQALLPYHGEGFLPTTYVVLK